MVIKNNVLILTHRNNEIKIKVMKNIKLTWFRVRTSKGMFYDFKSTDFDSALSYSESKFTNGFILGEHFDQN